MTLLAGILSSQVRAEIFRLLFTGDQATIHLRGLQRNSRLSIGTIQKEMAHLKQLDLVLANRDGNRLYYRANTEHPLYKEICGLVGKTTGVTVQIKDALSKQKGIECAFVFGSFAKSEMKAHSDIDLIVIGSIGLRSLSTAFKEITERVGREINPHVYSLNSWREKIKKKDHFITSVLNDKKVFLVGDESVLS
ncbi:MAG: toxin-antitoxin system toxin subunit [Bdellovibrio sp.]|nr:MAG: toxin-antitoxin system toxin subunit [Bdellovibrio sp.]